MNHHLFTNVLISIRMIGNLVFLRIYCDLSRSMTVNSSKFGCEWAFLIIHWFQVWYIDMPSIVSCMSQSIHLSPNIYDGHTHQGEVALHIHCIPFWSQHQYIVTCPQGHSLTLAHHEPNSLSFTLFLKILHGLLRCDIVWVGCLNSKHVTKHYSAIMEGC